jgi:hypothetical protein
VRFRDLLHFLTPILTVSHFPVYNPNPNPNPNHIIRRYN